MDKLQKLKELLGLLDSPTRKELADAIKTVIEFVKKATERMNEKIDRRLAQIKDGEDGKDGQKGDKGDKGDRGDKGERGATFIALRGAQGLPGASGKDGSPDTSEQVRDKLETLEGDERLDISAIKGIDEKIEKRVSAIPRGGGVSAGAVAHAFKYIAHTEEPVGAINGVNTTYTVKNDIWWIAGFTINGEQIAELPNFTYVNKTITFSVALPAAYSGKDFECKYIG